MTGRSIAVFNPRGRFVSSGPTTFYVHGERRLGSNPPRKLDEFICSKVARLQFIPPSGIYPNRPLVAGTDAPSPVIVLRNIAAGPTNKCRVQQADLLFDIAANSVFSVTWHQRDLIEPEPALPIKKNSDFRQVVRFLRN